MPELGVLLTPRETGGHEQALFGWLSDAVREEGLRVLVMAPTDELVHEAQRARLPVRRTAVLRALRRWPARCPLLLAPGVLHAAAWLLAAAVALGKRVWVYVPMTFSAERMGYRWAGLRDTALAPWLRGVERWITIDELQAHLLRDRWRVEGPVHTLPNVERLPPLQAPLAEGPVLPGLRVAYVGRFEPHAKGLDWLAATLLRRPAWALPHRFRFQGRGRGEWLLRELASALGPQQVEVHPQAPIDEALAVSDVLLLASRYEGVPLVALEATQRGRPVVATFESGLARLLPSASMFGFGDERGLRMALESLQDPAARRHAVSHARRQQALLWPAERRSAARREIVAALRAGGP